MGDPLATYLHDHLAGSAHAIDLLKEIRDQQSDKELGHFASNLLREIEADRETLQKIAGSVGASSSALKEMGVWLEEKVSRLKLRDLDENSLGTFEALEFLQLGIYGKGAMWRALGAIANADARLGQVDFGTLSERAEAQEIQVEHWRLKLAPTALKPTKANT